MPGSLSGGICPSAAKYKIVKRKDEKYVVYVKRLGLFWSSLKRYYTVDGCFPLVFTHFSDAQMAMEAHRLKEKERREKKKRKLEVTYFL